jgi:hypothetical protein
MKSTKLNPSIGWREWLSLPNLKVPSIKAKVDTGARTSSLHAFDVEIVRRRRVERVRFKIHPLQKSTRETIAAEAELIEHRLVRSSTGKQTLRPVIMTTINLMGSMWDIELTLTNRDSMGFRMLLGREAIRGRFVVDPGRSFLSGKNVGTTLNKGQHKRGRIKRQQK